MSKKISFRDKIIPETDAHKIKLSTINGKTGYKINKFQIIPTVPGGNAAVEYVMQIYNKNTGTSNEVDFSNGNLLAVAYYEDNVSSHEGLNQTIVFDNEIVNQDIFITCSDASGGTVPCNYFLELETIALTDLQATQLTLKNIRTITS